jgi:hypothetical protein
VKLNTRLHPAPTLIILATSVPHIKYTFKYGAQAEGIFIATTEF